MVRKMLLRVRSSMMMCCCLLPLIGGIISERILTAHTGQAVLLFSNTSVDNNNNVILYVNGNRKNTLLATWRRKNCTTEVLNMNPNYRERLDMDRNSNIRIWNVGANDTGKYCIYCSQTTTGISVQLNVLKELTKEEQIQGCLNDTVCLKKYLDGLTGEQILPSLNDLQLDFFKKYFGISHDTTIAQSQKDDTEDKMMPLLSSSSAVVIAVLVLMIISLMFNVVIAVVFISHKYACCQRRKRNLIGEQEKTLQKMRQEKKDLGGTDAHSPSVLATQKNTFSDNLHDEHSIPLLQMSQPRPTHDDLEHETKDATTDHQPSTNSEAKREFQELLNAALCNICFVNKKNIVFIPCNHVVTCANCSTTLEQCPVCRVKIEQRTKISF